MQKGANFTFVSTTFLISLNRKFYEILRSHAQIVFAIFSSLLSLLLCCPTFLVLFYLFITPGKSLKNILKSYM